MNHRPLWAGALALALAASGLVALPAADASAATRNSLTISKIGTRTAPWGKKATIKPGAKATGKVKILSKTLTVKKGSRTVARNKKSVALAAGKYRVTTTVKYRTWSIRTTTKNVKKKVKAVDSYTGWTNVTCVTRNVVKQYDGEKTSFDATCRGSAFDGTVQLTGIEYWDGWDYDMYSNELSELHYVYTAGGGPAEGKTITARLSPHRDLYRTKTVKQTTSTKVWSATKVRTRTQALTVKQGKRPNYASPYSNGECPSWAPVKGNANSGIYHVPGSTYYSRTKAEECFTTAAVARAHGYRAPLR